MRHRPAGWLLALMLGASIPCGAFAQAPPPAATPPNEEVTVQAGPLATQSDMEAIADAFFKVALDLEHPRTVKDFRLKRDTMELTLSSGTLYLAQPVGGKVTGAWYSGSGTMKVTLPNAFDRRLLTEEYGKEVFQESFDQVALRFDDGSEQEILAASTPGGTPIAGAPDAWAIRERILDSSSRLQIDFLESRINDLTTTAFFTATIHTPANDWYTFWHRGRWPIENWLSREKPGTTPEKRLHQQITSFHKPEDYDAKGYYDLVPGADNKVVAAMNHIEMTVVIPDTKSVLIDATLTVQALRDGVRAARFDFDNDAPARGEKRLPITVEGVQDDAGRPLPWLHREDQLVVILPGTLARGESTHVRVQAKEDTIVKLTSVSYWMYSSTAWYPRTTSGGEASRHTFDWTVKVAKPLQAVGSGDLRRTWEEGDLTCGRWSSAIPVRYASFLFGKFRMAEDQYVSGTAGSASIPLRLYTIGGGGVNPKSVLYNIKEGIKTYESVLGPYPFGDLDIAEMAGGLGFAHSPPGILLISSELGTAGGGGTSDQMIFHELAHQWWGHQVGRAGIEDAWISESWAEYTSQLITEAIDKGRAKAQRAEWRKNAFEVDALGGTIATAFRYNQQAWTSLLYNKGPCVLHMLRTWMGWEKFAQYMGTLQSKYRNVNITTDTLAREASTTLGYDMFPFFDQWVRGRGIPRIHYSWKIAPEAGGKQIVTISLNQEDELDFKVLMLPIALDFGTGTPTVLQKPILQAKAEIQLRVPQSPKNIMIDPGETQLATFINDTRR
ncbi:MAG TPA: M1 family aminopeptidase [Candidatus Polarisedimenticolia bacterium]|jgi:hypothetical protein|nr:M1 family aminopeptidase [Candidatus Polarisedimenticolia bacterium]